MFRLAVFSVLATAALAWNVKGYGPAVLQGSSILGSSLLSNWGAPTHTQVIGQPQYSSYSLGHFGGDLALGGVSSYQVAAAPVSEKYSTVEYVNLPATRKVVNFAPVYKSFAVPAVNSYSVAAPVVNSYSVAAPAVSTIATAAPAISTYEAPIATAEISAPVTTSYNTISTGADFPVQEKELIRRK